VFDEFDDAESHMAVVDEKLAFMDGHRLSLPSEY